MKLQATEAQTDAIRLVPANRRPLATAIIALAVVAVQPAAAERACSAVFGGPASKSTQLSAKRDALSALSTRPVAIVTGGGIALLTDADGQKFRNQFSISAVISSDGTTRGQARFSFSKDFSQKWGAVPGVSEIVHLQGEITSGSVSTGGIATLTGPFIETDFASGEGLIFREDSRVSGAPPLTLVISPASDSFSLTWCAFIPPNGTGSFSVEVVNGNLKIHQLPH
jgi:hypothetical protein